MIGTHNSATGECGKRWWDWLLVPFCRCQRKTLVEQFDAGCRYFDLRVNHEMTSKGHLTTFGHGLWKSGKSVSEALYELDMLAALDRERTYVSVTYEGRMKEAEAEIWLGAVLGLMKRYEHLVLTEVNVKKYPQYDEEKKTVYVWTTLWKSEEHPGAVQGFKSLDGKSWHTAFPLPWLWNWWYKELREDKDGVFVLVDFM